MKSRVGTIPTALLALGSHVRLSKGQTVQRVNHPGEPDSAVLYNSQYQACPASCESVGPDPAAWTSYRGVQDLSSCDENILFTFNVQSTDSRPLVKACRTSSGGPSIQAGAYYGLLATQDISLTNVSSSEAMRIVSEAVSVDSKQKQIDLDRCGATISKANLNIDQRSTGSGSNDPTNAAEQLESYFRESADCGRSLMFARSSGVIMGVFSGSGLSRSVVADLIRDTVPSNAPGQYAAQICHASPDVATNSSSPELDSRFLATADTTGDLSKVQDLIRSFINDGCTDLSWEGGITSRDVEVLSSKIASPTASNSTSTSNDSSKRLKSRALCRDIQVQSGDGCGSLADRCGISGNDFTKFNSKTSNLCSTLKVKQWVCCSSGDLPDHTPQPGSDGMCASYTIKPDDGCYAIADSFGIDTQRLIDSNKKTWGFSGCENLQLGQVICLSSGDPPMPAQDPTAICGPTMVGTKRPESWDDISDMNQCLLNACCNVWGQCGTTEEFCVDTTVNDIPGTREPGTNGCISNCGTDIVNNDVGPAKFARIGYFEGFNKARSCLTMDVTQFDTSVYTHIHFAFAIITPDFNVGFGDEGTEQQFGKMSKMDSKGAKKILSFGGWSFSTESDTAPIFSQSVSTANRELFADRVVQFMNNNNLDGLDFDWEYPGACK